jgi:hypothetical protein
MNIPFKVFNNYFQQEEPHKDQGTALASVYKSVTQDFQPLGDYTIMTKSRLGEFVVIPDFIVQNWFNDYYRADLFFQSIGLDPMGLDSFLESEGLQVNSGKMEFPKGLLDRRLYVTNLVDIDDEYIGLGATPMESILSSLTYMISRKGLQNVRQRFWGKGLWFPPGEGRTSSLFRKLQDRQPELQSAYRTWFDEETDGDIESGSTQEIGSYR